MTDADPRSLLDQCRVFRDALANVLKWIEIMHPHDHREAMTILRARKVLETNPFTEGVQVVEPVPEVHVRLYKGKMKMVAKPPQVAVLLYDFDREKDGKVPVTDYPSSLCVQTIPEPDPTEPRFDLRHEASSPPTMEESP